MTSNISSISNYTDAINALPPEAILGSLLWFSISQADVQLEQARQDLEALGLDTSPMRQILRPVDAFRKASREFAHKFKPVDGVRSELMVRPLGEDGEQANRQLILERAVVKGGTKKRIFYEKVGELVFTRGTKKNGKYEGYSVEGRRQTDHIGSPLTSEESAWLDARLADFEDRFLHLIEYMDSHAVRTYVRDFIAIRSGTQVKTSGGLYFVRQSHAQEIEALGTWVRSIGSEFHSLPLLNLVEQRQMILESFEDETIKEVETLMGEIAKILTDPDRTIEEKTFDAYGAKAQELASKVDEYNEILGSRAERAALEISIFSNQVMNLAGRIRQSKTTKAKVIP